MASFFAAVGALALLTARPLCLRCSAVRASVEKASSGGELAHLEEAVSAALEYVAGQERLEAAEREQEEKVAVRRRRRLVAAVKRAERKAEAAAIALAAAEAAEEAVQPLTDRAARDFSRWVNGTLRDATSTLMCTLNPSLAAAEAVAVAARAAEEEAESAAKAEVEAASRNFAQRMKKVAPSPEQFSVRFVRGLEGGSGGCGAAAQRIGPMVATSATGGSRPTADAQHSQVQVANGAVDAVVERRCRERSRLVGSVMYVDVSHPDFCARWPQTRQASEEARLCGYLATIVSAPFRERAYQMCSRKRVNYAQAYEELVSTYCRLEEEISAMLPTLMRELMDEK